MLVYEEITRGKKNIAWLNMYHYAAFETDGCVGSMVTQKAHWTVRVAIYICVSFQSLSGSSLETKSTVETMPASAM